MESTPPVTRKKKPRIGRVCSIIITAFVVIGTVGYFWLRGPHFNGLAPASIEVVIHAPDSPTPDSKILVQGTVTNGQACASLFALLRSARLRMDHKCGDIGSLTIRYPDGKADQLACLPGHDPTGYEFRFGGFLYRLPRGEFYRVLHYAGIDITKMPQTEH